jgi:hypothetical protein
MKKYYPLFIVAFAASWVGCADNTLDVKPLDENFPMQLVLDADEGAALPNAEDYGVEVKFADLLPTVELPNSAIEIRYSITDVEGSMENVVAIDKIVYEVELDDCVYERELAFTASADGLSGTIILAPDADLETVPEAFEVVFTLPGLDDTEGGFVFELTNLSTTENLLLGSPAVFEYEVLANDVAGEWELEIDTEEEFQNFQKVFGTISLDIAALEFADITGSIKVEFEYEEVKFEIELVETEEVTTCEEGETQTEVENIVLEIEAGYSAEDGEFELEGSYELETDDGVVEELDFLIEGTYLLNEAEAAITFTFLLVVDEDNFEEGEELYASPTGTTFVFNRD